MNKLFRIKKSILKNKFPTPIISKYYFCNESSNVMIEDSNKMEGGEEEMMGEKKFKWMIKNDLYFDFSKNEKSEITNKMQKLWREKGVKMYQDLETIYNISSALLFHHLENQGISYWNNIKKNLRWEGHQEEKKELPKVKKKNLKN